MGLFNTLQVNFPLCTIAHTPRMPEHCIEYVRVLLWSKENPFGGEGTAIDGDDPQHITWIMEKAQGGISMEIFDFECFFLPFLGQFNSWQGWQYKCYYALRSYFMSFSQIILGQF